MQESPVWFLGQEDPLEKGYRLPTLIFLDLPYGSAGKEIHLQCGRLGFDPWVGKSPGEGKGYPLQYSGLENSMDCTVHRVSKSRTQPGNFHLFLLLLHQLHLRSSGIIRSWSQGPLLSGKELQKAMDSRRQSSLGATSEAACHRGYTLGYLCEGMWDKQRWLFTVHWSLWFQTLLPKPQISSLHCPCEVNILVFEMLAGSGYFHVPSSVFWGDTW